MESTSIFGRGDARDVTGLMDEVDDLSCRVVSQYLVHHNFKEVQSRLLYDYVSGAGIGRALRNMWFEYMGMSSKELIRFYRRATRREELPHYESLIAMFLVSFLSTIAAQILIIEYKHHRGDIVDALKTSFNRLGDNVQSARASVTQMFTSPVKYLFRAFHLRDMVRRELITRNEHDQLLSSLDKAELEGSPVLADNKFRRFEDYEKVCLSEHGITSYDSILKELYEMLATEVANSAD